MGIRYIKFSTFMHQAYAWIQSQKITLCVCKKVRYFDVPLMGNVNNFDGRKRWPCRVRQMSGQTTNCDSLCVVFAKGFYVYMPVMDTRVAARVNIGTVMMRRRARSTRELIHFPDYSIHHHRPRLSISRCIIHQAARLVHIGWSI
jgi:hypothetical protein